MLEPSQVGGVYTIQYDLTKTDTNFSNDDAFRRHRTMILDPKSQPRNETPRSTWSIQSTNNLPLKRTNPIIPEARSITKKRRLIFHLTSPVKQRILYVDDPMTPQIQRRKPVPSLSSWTPDARSHNLNRRSLLNVLDKYSQNQFQLASKLVTFAFRPLGCKLETSTLAVWASYLTQSGAVKFDNSWKIHSHLWEPNPAYVLLNIDRKPTRYELSQNENWFFETNDK